jgi:hypothetical protein
MTCIPTNTKDNAVTDPPSEQMASPSSQIVEVGKTFADALRLMRRAKYFAFVVPYGDGFRWGHIRVSRQAAQSFLKGYEKPERLLHSELTRFDSGGIWLFVGEFDFYASRS